MNRRVFVPLKFVAATLVLFFIFASYAPVYAQNAELETFEEIWAILIKDSLFPPPDTPESKEQCFAYFKKKELFNCVSADPWIAYQSKEDGNVKQHGYESGDFLPVVVADLTEEVAYIRIFRFEEPAPFLFFSSLLERLTLTDSCALVRGTQKFIIDLRASPGGFNKVAGILGTFFTRPDDILFTLHSRNDEEVVRAKDVARGYEVQVGEKTCILPLGIFAELRMAVLVDKKTASAAEIFAVLLREYAKAPLVGTETFGKRYSQQIHLLKDGGRLRFTQSTYTVGNSKTAVSEIGLKPDYNVLEDYFGASSSFFADPEKDIWIQQAIELLSR